MLIVSGRPPNFQAIAAVFPEAKDKGVIFAYGDRVYVNGSPVLSPSLRAHEAMHLQRQKEVGGPDKWWDLYLTDKNFMLKEEVIAHRAEYGTIKGTLKDRNLVAQHLTFIAQRLASPLYGSMLTVSEAKQLILR